MSAAVLYAGGVGERSQASGGGPARRTALRRARVVALVVALGLVALELGLYHLGGYGRNPATTTDGELGYRTLPRQRVRTNDGTLVVINDDGYRDRAWRRGDPDESVTGGGRRGLRVAVLGDSVSYGWRVDVEATWPRRLEDHLRHRLRSPDVVVMNFAQPGYVFEQYARVWERDVRAFEPDVVLLAVNGHSAQPMQSFAEPRDFPLRAFVLKTATYDYLRRGVFGERDFLQVDRLDEAFERGRETRAAMRGDPYAPAFDASWAAARARCDALAADASARGARVFVVCVPQLGDVLGEPAEWCAERWSAWAAEGGDYAVLDALPVFREALAPTLDALAAAKIDPRVLWSRRADPAVVARFRGDPANPYLYRDPEHLNPSGHERLGAWAAARLIDAGVALGAPGDREPEKAGPAATPPGLPPSGDR